MRAQIWGVHFEFFFPRDVISKSGENKQCLCLWPKMCLETIAGTNWISKFEGVQRVLVFFGKKGAWVKGLRGYRWWFALKEEELSSSKKFDTFMRAQVWVVHFEFFSKGCYFKVFGTNKQYLYLWPKMCLETIVGTNWISKFKGNQRWLFTLKEK